METVAEQANGVVDKKAKQRALAEGKAKKKALEEAKKKWSPRKRVLEAQRSVLQQVDKILTGNCVSAKKGNYNCAKFVLDWSGVSEIRTPLAKTVKKNSLATALKKLRAARKTQE
ncbi:MAG TPA: hypothetical protein VGL89_02345 [Candidatus Koribacter sp.]|jgi:hypothetical protein